MKLVRCLPALMLIVLVGCGGKTSSGLSQRSYQGIRALSAAYEGYLAQNQGMPPQDEQAFRQYLESRQSDWDAVGISIDDMLCSPRTGEPFMLVCGKKPPTGKTGTTYIAYETSPVDGKRLVIAIRGMFEEMDEARFKLIFPGAL